MKKVTILFYGVMVFMTTIAIGQPTERPPHETQEQRERMEARKVAFLTEKLDLTVQEAQDFWPVYNEYSDKQMALRQKMRPPSSLPSTESEAKEMLARHLQLEKERLELQEEYSLRFQEVLPASKVLHLFVLERGFVQKVLKEFRRRHQEDR